MDAASGEMAYGSSNGNSTDVPLPGPSTGGPPRTAKIILIGNTSVGKTSLRNRYFKGAKGFSQAYIATIGADFVTKTLELQDGTRVSVQLWDTAGQERFQALGAAFYRGADACILVYSCENRQSYTSLERWFHSFVDKCPLLDGDERTFPFVCVGNKHDLVRSSDTTNLVDEEDVKALLGRLLPTLGGGDTVKKEAPPSSVPITTDTAGVKQQQTSDLRDSSSTPPSRKARRGSATSSASFSANRRSIDILPETSATHLSRTGSRGPSVYHTPSSSLAQPAWAMPSSVHPHKASSTRSARDKDDAGGDSLDLPPDPPRPVDGDASANGELQLDSSATAAHENEEIEAQDDLAAARDVFGVRDGIKHFYSSAKTGESLDEIFSYLAARISARWKWQEEQDALVGPGNGFGSAPGNVRRGGKNDSVKVGNPRSNPKERKGWRSACC